MALTEIQIIEIDRRLTACGVSALGNLEIDALNLISADPTTELEYWQTAYNVQYERNPNDGLGADTLQRFCDKALSLGFELITKAPERKDTSFFFGGSVRF